MREAYTVVNERVKKIGISAAELGRRTEINAVLLRNSLCGKRGIKADELVRLSRELGLELSDFYEVN